MSRHKSYEPLKYAIMVCVGLLIGQLFYKLNGGSKSTSSSVEQVMHLLERAYVDTLTEKEIEERGIHAMLQTFDPHSVYIPKGYVEAANQDLRQSFKGVGIEFILLQDTPYVVRVIEDGPASKLDIQPGDRILAADTIKLIGATNQEVVNAIKGAEGSTVNVQLYRKNQGKTWKQPVERGTVKTPSVYSYRIDESVLFVRIEHFAEHTHDEFVRQVKQVQGDGPVTGLILDLRNNPGGYLQTAIQLLDEIVDGRELLAYTKAKGERTKQYHATPGGICKDMVVACLVNERSASASEIVSGALQDLDRATIYGQQTFGKGLVQETYGLREGGQIRLTVARYYIPSGRSIQRPYDANGYVHGYQIDSNDIEQFKTKSGRIVGSHGGITPDSLYGDVQDQLRSLGTEGASKWIDSNGLSWASKYETWSGLPLPSTMPDSTRLRLIYQLYGITAYYEARNADDIVVQAALNQLK